MEKITWTDRVKMKYYTELGEKEHPTCNERKEG